ncbi:type VI secretion system Vgr family protein [Serratia sp. DD3]|uniref:type VI secretion system Vgr family protein n=1 Tax=Serratia sp. DD3 TaxID=1410619 RepID=UPI0003C50966|nr:type VI secretion system Vgr family protein [Serratia sp. DD3]KEY59312.1 Rhs element Vgr protein [Serratia sp. DD3]
MTSLPPILTGLTLNRYHLLVKGNNASLDVESFEGREGLSELYRYTIVLTSPEQDIDPATMLMKDASFIMQTLPQTAYRITTQPQVQRTVHGVITHFDRISASRDEAVYRVVFQPRLALLDKTRRTAIYQNQSVPEVVEKILRENHNWPGWLYELRLKHNYPKRELITQFMQSDFEFIASLLSEVGIWFNFTMDHEIKHEVAVFGDSGRNWQFNVKIPVVNPAGMHDGSLESVWDLQARHQVVEKSVSVKDYNYRTAGNPLDAQADITHDDDKTTYGTDYHYTDGYLTEGDKYASSTAEAETANFYARLRHERQLNQQHRLSLKSNATLIAPGQVLELTGDNTRAFANGMLVTAFTSGASRSSSYLLEVEGMGYRDGVDYRPALKTRPRITVPLPARVTSITPNDTYSHIDKMGRYRVKFDFDQDSWKTGYESPWLRLARPYAGETYGLHLPLLAGTEVSVMFDGGHPDKPFIAHVLHDSKHPDHVTLENYKRNVLRTPSNNKIRLSDERQKEHIKVSTEHSGKSQLNLGYNVDAKGELRGEGAELRTDGHGSFRAAKGIFISADGQPQAQGQMLDMQSALEELEAARQEAAGLRTAAEMAKAELADVQKQTALLNDTLKDLQQRALLLSAPAGIAQVTPSSLQLSAGQNLIATTGEDADFSIAKKMRIAVGETLSLFAKAMGIKLFAAAGKVEIQAQSGALDMLSKQDMTIASSDGKVTIIAKTELVLQCGGAFVRIKDGKVDIGSPGNVAIKCATLQKMGPASQNATVTLPDHCASMIEDATASQSASIALS